MKKFLIAGLVSLCSLIANETQKIESISKNNNINVERENKINSSKLYFKTGCSSLQLLENNIKDWLVVPTIGFGIKKNFSPIMLDISLNGSSLLYNTSFKNKHNMQHLFGKCLIATYLKPLNDSSMFFGIGSSLGAIIINPIIMPRVMPIGSIDGVLGYELNRRSLHSTSIQLDISKVIYPNEALDIWVKPSIGVSYSVSF